MSHYHVLVEQEDGWYVGRVLERAGVTTQGRTLDELVLMVRDAIEAMWDERAVRLELVLGLSVGQKTRQRKRSARRVA